MIAILFIIGCSLILFGSLTLAVVLLALPARDPSPWTELPLARVITMPLPCQCMACALARDNPGLDSDDTVELL